MLTHKLHGAPRSHPLPLWKIQGNGIKTFTDSVKPMRTYALLLLTLTGDVPITQDLLDTYVKHAKTQRV